MMQSFGGIKIICCSGSCMEEGSHVLPPASTLCLSVEELKQSLVATTVELETAKEELRKKEQTMAKLADLVRQVARERDDARDQVQQLLVAVASPKQAAAAHPPAALVSSSVTDSDCSLVSSSVDPFFDPVTSSDRRCGKLGTPPPPPPPAATAKQQCTTDAVLDMLARKKPLPARGRLLQSVLEAGPLLQNLVVAGQLPRWRNPPPLHPPDTLPVGAYARAPPLPATNSAAALGYVVPNADICMKRPMSMAAATSCSPGHTVGSRLGVHATTDRPCR